MKKLFASILILLFSVVVLYSQESINTTGGDISNSSGEISYSIGSFYQIQYPFEILVVTEIENTNGITLSISVYPNPTTDYLNLNVEDFDIDGLIYHIYDINGQELSKNIVYNQTKIDMTIYTKSIYFIKIEKDNKEIKTFKIIKS